jgi:nucleotide-binding universal stress UspA family protein
MKLINVAHKHHAARQDPEEELPPEPQPLSGDIGLRALLAVEEGNSAVESVEFLKRMLPAGSRVRLLTVRPYEFRGDGQWGSLTAQIPSLGHPNTEELQITLRMLEAAGARVSAKQRFGSPPDEILEEASDWGADLILVGHHNGLGRWFLGSVADSLLKRSVVPVLVVPHLGSVHEPARESFADGEAAGML